MGEERKKKRESFPLTEDEGWSRTWVTDLMAFCFSWTIDAEYKYRCGMSRAGTVGNRGENFKDDDKSI